MEKTLRRKIITLSIMLVLLVCFFCASVYAALTQTASIDNTIIVKEDGQAKTAIEISEALGDSGLSISDLVNEPQFSTAIVKDEDQDAVTGSFSFTPVFGGVNSYRFYIMRVDITNRSTVSVNYSVKLVNEMGGDFIPSSQLEVLYFQSEGETFSLTSSTGVGTLQIDGNAKEYVVLSIKESVAFDDLVPTDAHKFILQVEVSANEN